MGLDPAGITLLGDRRVDRGSELRDRVGFAVALVDARLRLDHLGERPERHAVAVGKAPALPPGDQLGRRVGDPRQLVHEPALADPRNADQRHELGNALLVRPLERVGEDRQLSLAPDQLRPCVMSDVDPESRPRRGGAPHRDRLRLPFRLDRGRLLVLHGVAGGPLGRLAHQDPVHGGGGLEPSGGVDDVAGCHALAALGLCVEPDERLARGDPDPQLETFLEREVVNGERRPHGPLGIVFVRDRCAEQRHNRVPDELLHRASVPLELRAHPRVVRPQQSLHVLGIEALRARREAHQVAEEDRHDLPLPARGSHHAKTTRPEPLGDASRCRLRRRVLSLPLRAASAAARVHRASAGRSPCPSPRTARGARAWSRNG